jgi:hypothetical protein
MIKFLKSISTFIIKYYKLILEILGSLTIISLLFKLFTSSNSEQTSKSNITNIPIEQKVPDVVKLDSKVDVQLKSDIKVINTEAIKNSNEINHDSTEQLNSKLDSETTKKINDIKIQATNDAMSEILKASEK